MLLNKYSGFGGGKKKSNSEFLSYNLMLNSGKKIRALRDKKKYSNSRVVRKKNSERKKTHSPPLQVKWSVP
jgi:hypothetical protein